jgi:hypothetical protein
MLCDLKSKLSKQKTLRDGELIKRFTIKMANAFSESKIVEKFKTLSLSHQTVRRRVSEMADNVSNTLRCVTHDCEYCSLGLDGSTNITHVCQLMRYVLIIDKDF